jgi:hypothetical protein
MQRELVAEVAFARRESQPVKKSAKPAHGVLQLSGESQERGVERFLAVPIDR